MSRARALTRGWTWLVAAALAGCASMPDIRLPEPKRFRVELPDGEPADATVGLHLSTLRRGQILEVVLVGGVVENVGSRPLDGCSVQVRVSSDRDDIGFVATASAEDEETLELAREFLVWEGEPEDLLLAESILPGSSSDFVLIRRVRETTRLRWLTCEVLELTLQPPAERALPPPSSGVRRGDGGE